MDDAVRDYIDAIAPEHRPLFDRLHRLVLEAHPDAAVVLSYQMPTYKVGRRRLFIGVWKHGVSIYGWEQGRDAGFTARHPELKTSKGTIQLRPDDAADIQTTSSATWSAPPSTPDHAGPANPQLWTFVAQLVPRQSWFCGCVVGSDAPCGRGCRRWRSRACASATPLSWPNPNARGFTP